MTGRKGGLEATHVIIVNGLRQFMVWPSHRPLPPGWHHVGRTGSKAELGLYLKALGVDTLARLPRSPRAAAPQPSDPD
jgi:uncharacterized protein YbdZ (MbtH family)